MSNAREPGRIMTEYKIIEVSEKPYLYVDRECPMQPSAISQAMGRPSPMSSHYRRSPHWQPGFLSQFQSELFKAQQRLPC